MAVAGNGSGPWSDGIIRRLGNRGKTKPGAVDLMQSDRRPLKTDPSGASREPSAARPGYEAQKARLSGTPSSKEDAVSNQNDERKQGQGGQGSQGSQYGGGSDQQQQQGGQSGGQQGGQFG